MASDLSHVHATHGSVTDLLQSWSGQVDAALEQVITDLGETDPLAPFAAALRYSLLGPGKRIRPALVLATAEAFGVEADHAMPVALAFELIHAYSLVHDDLPCMDDDDMRRGRPTSHKVYGDAVATLVGDGLQAEAFALVSSAQHLPAQVRTDIVTLLATNAGWRGMVGGQYLDIVTGRDASDAAALRDVHSRKTGALISAAVQAGAMIGNADPDARAACAAFGVSLGWLFQIVDDILDVVGVDEQMGRPAGSDERHDKVTALAVFGGVEAARRAADNELAHCLERATHIPNSGGALPAIASFVRTRDR